jgi:carboxymethylenebutenolidase
MRTASYHSGRLATDAADSPHLLAPKMKSRVYIAGAGIDHRFETYQAKHGWVFRDTPVYDAAAAERHWQTMFALFDATLKH